MTRFARAEGSKACNKKKFEEATPWEEMKSQMKKFKKVKKINKDKINNDVCINAVEPTVSVANRESEKNSGKPFTEKKEKSNLGKKIKSKKEKKKLDTGDVSEGKNKFDQKPSSCENEKNEDKPKKIKKRKRRETDISSGETNNSDGNVKRKKMVKEDKKQDFITENGVRFKVFKNNKKKLWYDLPYEENDFMTRYNKKYVKKENVSELDSYKQQLIDEGYDEKETAKKMFKREDKLHRNLRIELLRAEKNQANESQQSTKVSNSLKNNINKKFDSDDCSTIINPKHTVSIHFEENELMTLFDGYWIFTKSKKEMESVEKLFMERIVRNRNDGNKDSNLTEEELLTVKRFMKKKKRKENRLLKLHLFKEHNEGNKSTFNKEKSSAKIKSVKPEIYAGTDLKEDEMVKFEGFWIKKSAATRLEKLKRNLVKEGCSDDEIGNILKTLRRKEERSLKNENKQSCYKCRQSGHVISQCPKIYGEDASTGPVEFCFKCGSTEHMARRCNMNKDASYAHATCFICNEVGHISRECPDNTKGLYPNGGSCRNCGSVQHLQRDCTLGLETNGEESLIKVSVYNPDTCIDSIDDDEPSTKTDVLEPKSKKRKSKVIKF